MQECDIFSFVRSAEIREHFRKNWKMTMEQKVQLVARSYADTPKKVEALCYLASQSSGSDRSLAKEMARYLELGYQAVVSPKSEALYALDLIIATGKDDDDSKKFDPDSMLDTERERSTSYHISFEDMLSYMEVERDGDDVIYWEGYAQQFNFPFRRKKASEYEYDPDWWFYVAWVDGKWIVRGLEKCYNGDDDDDENKKWLSQHGISEETAEMASFYECHALGHEFSLPFERGSRLKLQTPLMDEPLIGIFDPHFVSDHWYLYLCAEDSFPVEQSYDNVPVEERVNKNYLLISYQLLVVNGSMSFCLWDWLERA